MPSSSMAFSYSPPDQPILKEKMGIPKPIHNFLPPGLVLVGLIHPLRNVKWSEGSI